MRGHAVPKALPDDVTLGDLTSKLAKPENFLRSVIGVMRSAAKVHGDVVIRLGITGTGRLPNYRIEDAATRTPIKAIDGNNHEPWTGFEDFAAPANWSSQVMTRADVENVLSGITGFKRNAPASNAQGT